MTRLEVTFRESIRSTLHDENAYSPQSRFLHRLHCLLLVGSGYSCNQAAQTFGDSPRSVLNTSSFDSSMNGVVSYAIS